MNKKGFTLVELLGVIVILAIILTIVVPNVVDNLDLGKKKTYEIMLKNIVTAAATYYEECEYSNTISDYCNEGDKTISLQTLVDLGFLTGSNDEENIKKVIVSPIDRDDKEFGNCKIKISRNIDNNNKITYSITSVDTNTNPNCPTTEELENGKIDANR